MLHIIMVDDDDKFIEILEKEVNEYFANLNYEYRIFIFNEYDEAFFNLVNLPFENKLYLLDIETFNNNGIDVAREIRRHDRESDILFLTAHDTTEYKNKIVTENIKGMGFVYKGNIKKIFFKKLDEFLENVSLQESFIIEIGSSKYIFPLKDILYVTTGKPERKTVIHSVSGIFEISIPLKEVEKLLFNKSIFFIKSHRSYTINISRVMAIQPTKQIILFSNNEKIQAISRTYRSYLLDIWSKYNTLNSNIKS